MTQTMILAAAPGQAAAAGGWGLTLAHLAYRVGGGPHLFRANAPVAPRGGLLVMEADRFDGAGESEPFCNEVLRECAARKFTGVVCRFRGRAIPLLGEGCPVMSPRPMARQHRGRRSSFRQPSREARFKIVWRRLRGGLAPGGWPSGSSGRRRTSCCPRRGARGRL